MQNTKWFVLGTGVLVMTLLTAGYAISGFKNHFDRHGKGFIKERVLSKVDYTMQELNLNTSQYNDYAVIRAKMSASMDSLVDRHERVHDSMKARWDSPNPDIRAMAQDLKAEISKAPNALNSQIDYLVEIYDILEPAQQQELVSMLKDHMKRHGCDDDD